MQRTKHIMYTSHVNNKMINLIVHKYKFNFFEDTHACVPLICQVHSEKKTTEKI